MIAGHFGFAAIVKSREPRVPLWSLMFATAWLDIVFIPLFMMNAESLSPVTGLHGGYGASIINADYSHSLLGASALSVVLGLVFGVRWGRRCAVVLGFVSFSHWLLDLLVHRGDMPILPANAGNLPRFGFALWQYPAISAFLELLLVLLGAVMYWRTARCVTSESNRGRRLAALAGCLIAAFGILILGIDLVS